jgi:hypothetical protein
MLLWAGPSHTEYIKVRADPLTYRIKRFFGKPNFSSFCSRLPSNPTSIYDTCTPPLPVPTCQSLRRPSSFPRGLVSCPTARSPRSAAAPSRKKENGRENHVKRKGENRKLQRKRLPSTPVGFPDRRSQPPKVAAAMVRGSLGMLASRALSVAGRWQHQQLRRLNIHEYQVPRATS